jgi:putative transposase
MVLTHKTECFPNNEQIKTIEQNFGMRRFFFNKTIMTLKHKYGDLKKNRKLITKKEVFSLRKELFRSKYKELTKTVPSVILDTALEDVMFSLNSLWKKGKDVTLRKKKYSNTCRFFRKNDTSFRYTNESKYISTIKLNILKLAEPLRFHIEDDTIRTITIKKQANRYFISITCELPDYEEPELSNKHIGIDWGLKTYLTCYDGKNLLEADFDNERLLKLDNRIAKYQRKLSKKKLYSNNWFKVKTKLEQSYLDFNNYRLDIIKKMVHYFNENYDSVTIEGLSMSFVNKNKRLAHRSKQKPFYLFKEYLINKFSSFGKKVYKAPKFYPSTQKCSNCGKVKTKKDKMKLGESVYKCNSCKLIIDRDENAAINLFNFKEVTV